MDSRLKCNGLIEFEECLGRRFEVQTFAWGVVEAVNIPPEIGCRDKVEIDFARKEAAEPPDGVFYAAFLPRAMRITEEGLNAEAMVEPVMLGELISVVEADGFSYRLREPAELTGDGFGGERRFSIGRTVNDVEAGLSLVKNQQPLTAFGEQHEVGFPMAGCRATFDLGGPFGNRAPVFDEVAAAASVLPSRLFAAWQQLMPVIPLGRAMIDKTID